MVGDLDWVGSVDTNKAHQPRMELLKRIKGFPIVDSKNKLSTRIIFKACVYKYYSNRCIS